MEWSELNRVQELVFKLLFTKEIANKMAFILKISSLLCACKVNYFPDLSILKKKHHPHVSGFIAVLLLDSLQRN